MDTASPALDLTSLTPTLRPTAPFENSHSWTAASLDEGTIKVAVPSRVQEELQAIVESARSGGLTNGPLFDPDNLVLGATRETMEHVREVLQRWGIAVVDRLTLDTWTMSETRLVYWLLGTLLSNPVVQKGKGTIFRDVSSDPERSVAESKVTGRKTSDRGLISQSELSFHNDNSGNRALPDYVGLLCVGQAKEGGVSKYCTVYSLYNALHASAPAELERLFDPFYHDRMDLQPPGEPPISLVPALAYDGQRLTGRMSTSKIAHAYKLAGQEMDPATAGALDRAQQIIEAEHLAIEHTLERGQIQFIDNRQGFHCRTDFVNGETKDQRRHLVRMWLRDSGRAYSFDG